MNRSFSAHPRLAALLLGLAGATAYPPLAWWPLGLAAIAGLVLLVRGAGSWRQATAIGWLFGFAHLTLANNWIATAFTHQAKMPAFLGWVAVPLLCLYLALYPALAALGAHLLDRIAGRRMPLVAFGAGFAACWIIAEWLRSWVFTGYPWPPLGLMLLGDFARPGIARLVPWLGTYALSGLAVLLASALLALIVRRHWLGAGGLAVMLVAGMLWPMPAGKQGTLAFTLVQPNLSQADLNDGTRYDANFRKLAALSPRRADDGSGPRLVLWPEGVIPDYLETGYPDRYYAANMGADPLIARRIFAVTAGPDSLLLAGTQDLEFANGEVAAARNSVTAIGAGGARLGSYDKAHLVPYGEYLALRWLLEPLGAQRLVAGSIDFWPGPGPRTLPLCCWAGPGCRSATKSSSPGRWSIGPIDRTTSSTRPTMAGSAPGVRRSIWRSRGSAQLRKGCRCCARRPPESAR